VSYGRLSRRRESPERLAWPRSRSRPRRRRRAVPPRPRAAPSPRGPHGRGRPGCRRRGPGRTARWCRCRGCRSLRLVLLVGDLLAEELAVRGAGGLHGDDVGIGVALAEVASHPHQRPAGAAAGDHGAHLPVERLVDLGGGRLVVGLGVERVRELLGTTASSSSSAISWARSMANPIPSSLGVLTTSAPSARMSCCFSTENRSGTTNTAFSPNCLAATASPIPVLPAVGSTTVPPSPRRRVRACVRACTSRCGP